MQGDSSDRRIASRFRAFVSEALKAAYVLFPLSPKRRPLSTKRWLPPVVTNAEICRGAEGALEAVHIRAIWGVRFTVPKVLGSMVRNDTRNLASEPWILLKS